EFLPVSGTVDPTLVDGSTYDVTDNLDANGFSSVGQTWGPESANAQAGDQRFFVRPNNGLNYLALNTNRVLANAELRLAVNYAINRSALTQAASPYSQTAWSQYLTPGIPGLLDDSGAFPLIPDQAQASQHLAASGLGNPPLVIWCPAP